MLKVINTKIHLAAENMKIDEDLLSSLTQPTLHLYDWKANSVTYGCFIDPAHFFRREGIEKHGLDLAKRPTGGGIVFHMWDLAFSFLLPASHPLYPSNVLDSYRFVHEIVQGAILEFISSSSSLEKNIHYLLKQEEGNFSRFCMAHPSHYDLMISGKKVAGAAQRRTKKGFLHQGSIFLKAPEKKVLSDCLLQGEEIYHAMTENSYPLIPEGDLVQAREDLSFLLTKSFNQKFPS